MQKQIRQILKYTILFILGGCSYTLIEILYRGYSHYSMWILGGICFICIGLINEILKWETPLVLQGLIGSFIVTLLEFITGYIVNIRLGMRIWDYSRMPLNIMGQVCLNFTIIWFFISIFALIADDYLRYWLFDEERPHYKLF